VSLALGYVGFRLNSREVAPPRPPAPAPVVSAAPPAAEIPLFVPSALPEVAPVSPGSLPDAKR